MQLYSDQETPHLHITHYHSKIVRHFQLHEALAEEAALNLQLT